MPPSHMFLLPDGGRLRFVPIAQSNEIFYGWWIAVAAFLNLFFAVGIIFYGFPVFYPALAESLGFTRAQLTQGFLLGFLIVGLPFGLIAGVAIDRLGARWVILSGAGLVGISLMLMGWMTTLWHYELLCITEVFGYVLAGPIANQVLVAKWFDARRGRAMGYVYLGLGLGGVVSPQLSSYLIRNFGWRHALEVLGLLIMVVLIPVGLLVTRSAPADLGLLPDGAPPDAGRSGVSVPDLESAWRGAIHVAVRTRNFWLILAGSTLAVGAIGAVIQHFILFLKDQGYSATSASRFFTALLVASLGGRVLVGYLADRFRKKNLMAFFYASLSASVLLIGFSHSPLVIWSFVVIFGFSMGADYMLIPLVTAECFGTASLGKLLALIIMGYSLGQWGAPWIAGRIFDARHSYELAWNVIAVAGMLGAAAIFAISPGAYKASA
ncbi:MAG: MFS transporter [Acidobacteriota bacterium]|nr:MFS transporter [Acidobacteriota bacterium]